MMRDSELISIIVPCYNQAAFLDQCIQSLQAQTWRHWECIIVNDGSTDDTADRGRHWQNADPRIRYLEKPNGGLSSARNEGLAHAKGAYVQFLDSDDFLAPAKLESSIKQLTPGSIVITDFYRFDDAKQQTLPPHCVLQPGCFTLESFVLNWDFTFSVPIHCAIFARDTIGPTRFMEDLKAKEDWAFWLQVVSKNPQIRFIAEPLAFYRMSSAGMTKNEEVMNTNRIAFIQKIGSIIDDTALLQQFYKKNLIAALKEKAQLQKRIKYMEYKRTVKYKMRKLLKMAGFKINDSLADFTG